MRRPTRVVGRVKSVLRSSVSLFNMETSMANVIYLKDRPPSSRRFAKGTSDTTASRDIVSPAGAEILLYTGVRYERYASETAPDTRPSNSGSKRARKR